MLTETRKCWETKGGALALAMGVLCLGGGCKKPEISVYSIPKEQPAAANAAMAAGGQAGGTPHLHYTTPEGWREQAPSRMRVASFVIEGDGGARKAELAVVPLPGVGGIERDSVNLWRKDQGLPEFSEEDFKAAGAAIPVSDGEGRLYDMESVEAKIDGQFKSRTLGVVATRAGTPWFFKLSGESDLVKANEAKFLDFLKEVQFHSGSHGAPPATAGRPAARPASDGPPSVWTVPDGWKATPPGQMVLASFQAPGADGAVVETTVSMLSGDGGGVLANVNRWRGQMQLPPAQPGELEGMLRRVDIHGHTAVFADMEGVNAKTGKPARMVAAIVPEGGGTWFYKMSGPAADVEREQANLLRFVESAHPKH